MFGGLIWWVVWLTGYVGDYSSWLGDWLVRLIDWLVVGWMDGWMGG